MSPKNLEIQLRSAERADVLYVAARLREADRRELEAASGMSCEDALLTSWLSSDYAVSGIGSDGMPLALFGYRGLGVSGAVPWCACTERVQFSVSPADARAFLRISREVAQQLEFKFTSQKNYVMDEHTAAKRWLRALGYKLCAPEPYGPFGALFCKFYKYSGKL